MRHERNTPPRPDAKPKKLVKKKPAKSEKALDRELEESFPASDPPSHNPGAANPPTD